MASKRQIKANARNGPKGGPKTAAGKQRSRGNALRHGLTASTIVVLPEEQQKEFDDILGGFGKSFKPEDPIEEALVLRLSHAHWRSLRSRRIETGILGVTAKVQRGRARDWVENCPEHLDLHEAIGVGFMVDPPERWQMYLRYDTTISRDFFKTLDALTKLQRARQPKPRAAFNPMPQPARAPEPGPPLVFTAGAGPQLSDSGIGSDSQIDIPAAALQFAGTGLIPGHGSVTGLRVSEQAAPALHSVPNLIEQTKDEQLKASHETKQHKRFQHRRRTLRSARPTTDSTAHAPDTGVRKKRYLRRLLANAGVLPRLPRRATQRNNREMGRPC